MHKSKKPIPVDWSNDILNISEIPIGTSTGHIEIIEDRLGRSINIPVMALKGESEGPVVGITAAVHGNEINGIPVIHQVFDFLKGKPLVGTIIAIPVVNVPGYLAYQRRFVDGYDLNRSFHGKKNGIPSSEYAYRFMERIVKSFNYLFDLHTASFGRINSHYVRADISHPKVRELASVQYSEIIVHTKGPENTLRQAAMDFGIPSLTIELGDPQVFQSHLTQQGFNSIINSLIQLGVYHGNMTVTSEEPVFCETSKWIRCNDGGILTVIPPLTKKISKGDIIAQLVDIYGRKDITYTAVADGIVIGKNSNPVVSTGDRILHYGDISQTPILDYK